MKIIDKHFTHLSPYTKLLLNDPTQCWFLLPDGNWIYFNQNNGLPQGHPFSPVFAALVLHAIIEPIDKYNRKWRRILGDDKNRGITNLLAYVNDLNCVILLEYSLFFCQEFQKLANNIGLKLNYKKLNINISHGYINLSIHFQTKPNHFKNMPDKLHRK